MSSRHTAVNRASAALAIALVTGVASAFPSAAQQKPDYPQSRVQVVTDRYGDVDVQDAYRWLEDQNAPETRAWIDAQNRFRQRMMADVPGRQAIAERLDGLLRVDVTGTPRVRGGRYFFAKRTAGQDQAVIYVREGIGGTDVPLVDPNLTATAAAVSVAIVGVSEDGSLLAYSIREGGQDEVIIRFMDVETRRLVGEGLSKGRYFGVEFTPDDQDIYYTRYESVGSRLYRRGLSADSASEQLLYGEDLEPENIMNADLSPDGRYVLLSVYQGSSGPDDLYLKDVLADGPVVPMTVGDGAHFSARWAGDRIVIQSDLDAPNNHVLVTTPDRPALADWREIVPETGSAVQGISLAGGYVWVRYLENVVGVLKGFDLDGRHVRDLGMPTLGTLSGLSGEFDQDEAFFTFESFNVPPTTYRYSVSRRTRDVWSRQNVDFDSDAYRVEQVWYESRDGTKVPMFVAHREGIRLDGTNPTYLTGYGGFDIAETPTFSARYAVWLEAGGVLALPNLRGGSEFGEAWHQAALFGNKQNVFDDFIAAAEWLIDHRYTSPDRLAIAGGSNGGLLVGAAMTQRPDLFRAVVCQYPLLDMLRYQNFLVARYWVSEYGSSDNPDQFEYLRAYSPYQNVREGVDYPAVLFVTGDGDTRVAPLHARKMTALMQEATGSSRPVLLMYDTEAGHSGGLPVGRLIETTTSTLLFVMWQLDMTDRGALF